MPDDVEQIALKILDDKPLTHAEACAGLANGKALDIALRRLWLARRRVHHAR